jgi:DNA-binding CsgD family transcriptional regulator/TolA-binding protein
LPKLKPHSTHKSAATVFQEARSLFAAARLSEAARLLDESFADSQEISDDAVLLRGRLYLRIRPSEPSKAVAFLARALPRLRSGAAKAEGNILLGAAHARVGDHRSAHSKFSIAARELKGDETQQASQLKTELAYQSAVALWMQRKLDDAERELKPVLKDHGSSSRVDALVLSGALYAARGRLENQASTLLEALRALLVAETKDVYRWGYVVSQLALLSRELPNQSIRNAAFEQVDKVPWTDDLAEQKYISLRGVGWRRALEGDYFNAFRYLKLAGLSAPTPPWRVLATCDRAYLATNLGEARFAEQELREAAELADAVEWRAVSGEERFALILLAELYAPLDGALALSYVARFQETGDRYDAVLSSNADRRVEGMLAYSLGYVRQQLGDSAEADDSYRKAFAIYDDIGYDWRAARAAMCLFQVNQDSGWLDIAAKKLRPYPLSWLVIRLKELALSETSSLKRPVAAIQQRATEELTPAQAEVYELLLTGAPTRDIAKTLHRSEFTVRNHIKAIFKKLKVNSRAVLLSETFRS